MRTASRQDASGRGPGPSCPEPKVVGLPLRGEWAAVNTPAHRVPSHGTDALGQRFAYDFVRLGPRDSYHRGSPFQLWTVGVPLTDCYGYGQEILAPFAGKVIEARDGIRERARLRALPDLLGVLKASIRFGSRIDSLTREEIDSLVGNHVIMQGEGTFAVLAHMADGSVQVREGQEVAEGDLLGRVGHSGNSTAPHLHFQLMDGPDALRAQGVACAFREYEELVEGTWRRASGSMPGRLVRIRL